MKNEQLKKILKSSNFKILLSISSVLIILFLIIFVKKFKKEELVGPGTEASVIEIQDKDRLLSVDWHGQVKVKTPIGVFYQSWEDDKTDVFFQYIKEKIKSTKSISGVDGVDGLVAGLIVNLKIDGEWQSFTIDANDELVNLVFEEVVGGYSLEEIASGEVSDYFEEYPLSSPTASSDPSQSDSAQTDPSQDNGTSSQDDASETDFFQDSYSQTDSSQDGSSIIDTCPYWRLSYCVYPWSATPSPAPVYWQDSTVVKVPDCDLWQERVLQSTVISNTICIEEP